MGRQEQTNHLFSNRDLRILLVPLIVEQILNSLMGTADSIMVSNVGSAAISAVSLVDSINILVIQAFYALAAGGTIVCSQYIGQKDKKNAEESARQLSFVVACISSAVMAVCLLTRGPLLRLIFGSVEADVMEAAQTYFFYTALSFPFIALYDAGSSIYRAQGNTRLPMTIAVVSNGLNIAGNAVLIWGFHLGVAGAAIATCLGYCVPSIVGLVYFTKNRTGSLYFVPFKFDGATLAAACGNGSSEMVSNIANAITTFVFNTLFMRYRGEDGVAAITIAMYFQFVFTAVYFGFSMGVAPVISYKFGEKNIPQLRHIFRICMTFVLACSLGTYVLSWLTLEPALTLFTPRGSSVYEIAMHGFPIYAVSFLLMGTSIFASSLFTALSDGLVSAIISFSRTLVFLVAMLLLLPLILQETGIWLAVPVAEALGVMVSVFFLVKGRKKYQY